MLVGQGFLALEAGRLWDHPSSNKNEMWTAIIPALSICGFGLGMFLKGIGLRMKNCSCSSSSPLRLYATADRAALNHSDVVRVFKVRNQIISVATVGLR
jgi:hypothetical protein